MPQLTSYAHEISICVFTVTETLTDRMQRLELVNSSVLGSVGNCGGSRIQSTYNGVNTEGVVARDREWADHGIAAKCNSGCVTVTHRRLY